jgi:hypothetical protein
MVPDSGVNRSKAPAVQTRPAEYASDSLVNPTNNDTIDLIHQSVVDASTR